MAFHIVYAKSMKDVVKETGVPKEFSLSCPQKISLKGNCAFSLPAGPKFSCPGATKACEGCYAMNKRHLWPAVQKAFARNWRLLKHFERYDSDDEAMHALLKKIPKAIGVFRIHESGDFHSQWAIDVWDKIIRERKDVLFWTYTRSFTLSYAKIMRNKNFTLWASTDSFNVNAAEKFVNRFRTSGIRHAYGPWAHDKEIPPDSFICPVVSKKIQLNGACEKCKLCVIRNRTKKNVVFLAH